jgi:hypothetical protein
MAIAKQLGEDGRFLSHRLNALRAVKKHDENGLNINVAGVGRDVSYAYEQLRNAAEYTQEHLLVQGAIRRFYVRNLSFLRHSATKDFEDIAQELVTELIQAGYVENNSKPVSIIKELAKSGKATYDNYWRLKDAGVKSTTAQSWTLDLLSMSGDRIIFDNTIHEVYSQFAYQHYKGILKKSLFVESEYDASNFEACIYVAVFRSLFKSDLASVRYDMQTLYRASDENIIEYIKFHNNIDTIFSSVMTDRLTQYINKYGAPLRIFKNMIDENRNIGEVMASSERFHAAYAVQIDKEYRSARTKLNNGLFKSIIFLFITKSLIGVSIEVPYDLAFYGEVHYLPLAINLLSPAVYLLLLRLGLKTPSEANTKAMQSYADNMLYGDSSSADLYPSPCKHVFPASFKVAYTVTSLLIFAVVVNILVNLGFNWVHGLIFFIFFATANFLGFRLSRIVRELELVTTRSGLLASIRDFIYMPFIMLGQWISEKYSKVNIIALILDTAIELPLKTVLRLVRQWTEFINDKKDEI